MFKCPICLKEYTESSFDKCTCGFEDFNAYDHEDETLFKIFKFTKNVFLKRIEYPASTIEVIYEDNGKNFFDIISKPRGLEIVDELKVINLTASNGILAFCKDTKVLILNCDYAHREFLDESNLRILFIGEKFKGFLGEPLHLDRIKYLYIHKDNPYFIAVNNKLKNVQFCQKKWN